MVGVLLVYVVYSPKSGMSECVVWDVVIFVNVAFGRVSWLEIQVGATGLREGRVGVKERISGIVCLVFP
jgi:hypothetical protein